MRLIVNRPLPCLVVSTQFLHHGFAERVHVMSRIPDTRVPVIVFATMKKSQSSKSWRNFDSEPLGPGGLCYGGRDGS